MIGEAVFALAHSDVAERVERKLKELEAKTVVSSIEWGPARLIEA